MAKKEINVGDLVIAYPKSDNRSSRVYIGLVKDVREEYYSVVVMSVIDDQTLQVLERSRADHFFISVDKKSRDYDIDLLSDYISLQEFVDRYKPNDEA